MRTVESNIRVLKKIPETIDECQNEVQCTDCDYFVEGRACQHINVLRHLKDNVIEE